MKVRVLFSTLLVIVLLSSMLAPLATAQEPSTTVDNKEEVKQASLDKLEEMYDRGQITKEEYLQAVEELGQPQSCGPDAIWPGPDGFGYAGETATYNWVDISGTGTAVYLNCDDCNQGPFPIGFTFPFYGVDYAEFYVESNGLIEFGPVANDYSSDCPLPSANGVENFLAPHWDDLNSGNNNAPVYYEYFPVCPYGSGECMVVEYYDFYHLDGDWAGTWEAIFYPNGDVVYQYFEIGPQQGQNSTTGIEGLDIDDDHGLTYACNSQGSIYDGLALRIYISPPAPNLSNSFKEVWPTKVMPGDVLTYTVHITNTGSAPALQAVMTDVIPAGTEFISGSLTCDSGTCWYDEVDNAVYWNGEVGMPASAPISIPASDGNFPRGDGAPSAGPAPIEANPDGVPLSAPLLSLGTLAYATEAANGFHTQFDLDVPEILPNLGPFNPADFPGAGEFVDDFVYVADVSNNLYQLDPATGGVISTIPITPPPNGETYSGFALDPTSGVLYASSTNVGTSSLFTVDVDTGVATLIGPITGSGCNIAIAIDGTGQIYGYDICTDDFWAIDKNTGAGTVIGSIGFDANFGQGMGWDPATDQIYLAAFNYGTFQPELRVADRGTGNTALVGVLGSTDPGGTCQLPWLGVPIETEQNAVIVEFAVEVVDAPCGQAVVNEAVITDPEAPAPVVVQAFAEVWDTIWLHEEFEGVFPPDGWTVIDNVGSGAPGSVWGNDNPGGRDNLTGGSGLFAIVDSDEAYTVDVDTELWLPPIDIPTCQDTFLVFKTDYYNLGDTADVDISLDGGATWENLLRWTSSVRGPYTEWVPLGGYSGATGATLRFHYYNANYNWWWEIDDVQIVSCVREGLFLTPEYQESESCAGEVVSYTLSLENCTGMTDTFSLYPMDNDWFTWVEPGMVEVPDTGVVDVTAYVQSACDAEGSDLATIVAADGGYSGTAEIETMVSEVFWVWNAENADMAPMPSTLWGGGDGIVMDGDTPQFWHTAGIDPTGGTTAQTWYYDWSAGAWMDGGLMPSALYRTEADIQLNEIYNIGGSSGSFTPTDLNQHYTAGAWQYETPAPAISMDEVIEPWPAAYGGNDHTYLVGGYQGGGVAINTAYEYDPVADAWTTLSSHGFTPMSYPVDGCFGWTDGSGGADPVIVQFPDTSSAQTNLLVYHIATDTWEEWPVPDGMLPAIWAPDIANDYDRNLCYITGGATVPGAGDLTTFYIYDPATNTVEQGPDFDTARDFHSSWYYEDMLCIGGGTSVIAGDLDSTQCAMRVACPEVEANIEVTAPPLEAELCEDEIATFEFEICNTGDCPLEFWIEEMTGTVKFLGSRPFGAGELGTMAEVADLDLSAENVEGAPSPAANPDAVLWDQPTNVTGAPASQYFPDFGAGLWSADDFENAEWWAIDTIYVPGSLWNGDPQGDLFDAYSLNWFIYADAGDTPPPGVYPNDGSGTEVWSLSLAPGDSAVTISGATNNEATVDIIDAIGGPLYLPPGHYWLAFFPAMDFIPHGQFGWQTSGTMNLASAHFADPDGLISPLDWTPWGEAINPEYYDAAFRLEGELRAPPVDVPWVSEMPDEGVLPTGWCMTVEVTLDATDLLPGDYLADLIIHSNDPDMPTTTLNTSLTVLEPAGIASVTYITDALQVSFEATVTGAPPIPCVWDFGDGFGDVGENPVHTYADEGCYTVTLEATNACGVDVWSDEVCVEIPFFYYYLPMLYKNG
jgi:uncharacterized repeat protein (TIGR01451 family)